jgi:hypothetical protein
MASHNKKTRRHVAVRKEVAERVQLRLALARTLAERTRMMIARLDRQLKAG